MCECYFRYKVKTMKLELFWVGHLFDLIEVDRQLKHIFERTKRQR